MKALIWKDLYCMRGFLKQVVATEAILLGIGVTMNNPAMIAFALLFLSLSLIQASMSVDEKNRWERYALTMPFSRRDMVASKYVLLTAIAVVMGILLMLLNMVLAAVRGEDLTATAAAYLAVAAVYLMIYEVSLPFLYKLGVERGRYVMMGIMVAPVFCVALIAKCLPPEASQRAAELAGAYIWPLLGAAVAAAAVGMYVSYRVSLAIYRKKEF